MESSLTHCLQTAQILVLVLVLVQILVLVLVLQQVSVRSNPVLRLRVRIPLQTASSSLLLISPSVISSDHGDLSQCSQCSQCGLGPVSWCRVRFCPVLGSVRLKVDVVVVLITK